MEANNNNNRGFTLPLILSAQAHLFNVLDNKDHDPLEPTQQVKAECRICPIKSIISGSRNATGNFYTHLRRKHPAALKKLANLKTMTTEKQKQPNQKVEGSPPDKKLRLNPFERMRQCQMSKDMVGFLFCMNTSIVYSQTLNLRVYAIPDTVSCPDDTDFLNEELRVDIVDIPDFSLIQTDDTDMDEIEITLPQHYRCCSHTLNLIATKDVEAALKDATYKRVYHSSFAKLTGLWNLCHRSTSASDAVEQICKCKLLVPCETRWNSFYDSVTRIITLKDFLSAICEKQQKPKLKSPEMEFLEEYKNVMEPLAKAIDILQGEDKCYLGYVLPTLIQIRQTLNSLTHLVYCDPLKNAILESLSKRFGEILDLKSSSKQYILATVSLPKFKLKWLAKTYPCYDTVKSLFLSEMERLYKMAKKMIWKILLTLKWKKMIFLVSYIALPPPTAKVILKYIIPIHIKLVGKKCLHQFVLCSFCNI
ncbi:unnamed protein product [Brassicogethes aeneus]|uniref:BED-type domain-containing protein n=1 Tax=Brassicogethes aeneus TaxID=1431903 RepID=A0A9P0FNN6_BRAAE|nr:unnamed protein product [Brassicogethes aeneus]